MASPGRTLPSSASIIDQHHLKIMCDRGVWVGVFFGGEG